MMRTFRSIATCLRAFAREEDGAATIGFVTAFPVFMVFFLMTYENGMITIRHVMLERGLDLTVRQVRIGALVDPSREELKRMICDNSLLIPDCMNQLQLEILVRDTHAWDSISRDVQCVDRGNPPPPDADDAPNALENNQLVFLRACARFDPIMPTTGIGRAIAKASEGDSASGGSYALMSSASFVIEPFKRVAPPQPAGTN